MKRLPYALTPAGKLLILKGFHLMNAAQLAGGYQSGHQWNDSGTRAATFCPLPPRNGLRDGMLRQQKQRRWASYRLAGDSPLSETDSPRSAEGLPPELAALLPLAEPARTRRRLQPEQMRDVIEAPCRERWLSAADLARLLQRAAEKLQTRLLSAMAREGRLKLRHPDVPNRPDQAYRAVAAAPPGDSAR